MPKPSTLAGFAALMTIAWGIVMWDPVRGYSYPHGFLHGVDSPVIAMEISRGEADRDAFARKAHDTMERENHLEQISRALAEGNPPGYIVSLVKWGLWGLAVLWLDSLSTRRLIAIGYLLSGVLVLVEVAFGAWIGYSHIGEAIPGVLRTFSLRAKKHGS